jgi:hypothetical protein
MDKLLVVFGATGQQGGSVVDYVGLQIIPECDEGRPSFDKDVSMHHAHPVTRPILFFSLVFFRSQAATLRP